VTSELPERPLWGEQTQAALKLFDYGPVPRSVIQALGEVKKAAVQGQLASESPYPEDYNPYLLQALDEIIRGDHDAHFPLNLRMGSAGTSLHMNLNEVTAQLANDYYAKQGGNWKAHPLDHINLYQSTNDVLPTALSILLYRGLQRVEEEVIGLQEALVERENRYDDVLILGRTELQDALPMKLGQIFAAWSGAVERDRWRINKLKERCRSIALGGTALGTCFSAPRDYVFEAERALRGITGLPLSRSQNLTDEVAMQDKAAEVLSGLGLCADNLEKIGSDLLLYSSSFLGELPQTPQIYGSTIMAGKSNPVLLEYLAGLARDIRGECDRGMKHCRSGQLQLNAWLPFIILSFLEASQWLEKALHLFTKKILPNMEPDQQKLEKHLYRSPALIQALRPWLDYERIKELHQLLMQSENPPENPVQWVNFLEKEGSLDREFLENFLKGSALTGFYRKEG